MQINFDSIIVFVIIFARGNGFLCIICLPLKEDSNIYMKFLSREV